MTTNVSIIGDALKEIGVISEIQTPSPEQGTHALRQLNGMMNLWRENGINLGYFKQSATTDTIPIPEWAEDAVVQGLAIRLAPNYGANVSLELATNFTESYRMVSRKTQVEALEPADMTHLPLGRPRGLSILTDT